MRSMTEADPGVPPAPGEEQHICLALANSALTQPGLHLDRLATPADAEHWLLVQGLTPAPAGLQEMCAAQVRSLREHLRSLLASYASAQPAHPAALAAVNDALTRVPTARLLQWDEKSGPYRSTPHPTTAMVDHALAAIAADAADLLTGPDAPRLAACASPPCTRFLLRQGRRQWCSTRCGDRARAARAYARRTAPDTPDAPA
ncbi:CGNR zinc finger domain-containing protein [Kitasatospora sp. NPDC051170]|uniref:CGNR zinc finger domain-containing protein n=1 Tax=Kitasatospora sp. NPDC051170 TaxID=3364056 RepID=UPI003795D953